MEILDLDLGFDPHPSTLAPSPPQEIEILGLDLGFDPPPHVPPVPPPLPRFGLSFWNFEVDFEKFWDW